MRVVFLGTPKFAVPSLEALLDACHVAGVITQPDRPSGRGQKLVTSPVKILADRIRIPVFQPLHLRGNPEVLRFLREAAPELMVVVAFGQILPRQVYDFSPLGTLNVHASLLPQYRGAAPVAHALVRGERVTGVTIMRIDEGMDTGDILSQAEIPIGENVTAGEVEDLLARKGAELLVQTLPAHARGQIRPQAQDGSKASYAPRLRREDGLINWSRQADQIHDKIRGLNPWPVAFSAFRNQKLRIWRSEKAGPSGAGEPALPRDPGEVLATSRSGIVVQCGKESLLTLKELQLPNRKRLPAWDFANGVNLKAGEIFG